MLFQCIEGNPITIDGKPVLKNLQINFAGNRQLRLKCELIDGNKVEPIDIVVCNYSDLKITPLNVSAFATVRDMNKGRNILLKLLFEPIKGTCRIEADVNGWPINKNISTPEDLIGVLRDILGLNPISFSNKRKGGNGNEINTFRKMESV